MPKSKRWAPDKHEIGQTMRLANMKFAGYRPGIDPKPRKDESQQHAAREDRDDA